MVKKLLAARGLWEGECVGRERWVLDWARPLGLVNLLGSSRVVSVKGENNHVGRRACNCEIGQVTKCQNGWSDKSLPFRSRCLHVFKRSSDSFTSQNVGGSMDTRTAKVIIVTSLCSLPKIETAIHAMHRAGLNPWLHIKLPLMMTNRQIPTPTLHAP